MKRRRRWVLAPVVAGDRPHHHALRATSPRDDAALAALLDDAYKGTIDHDPGADHAAELATWRQVDEADDAASALAVVDGEVAGAVLIGRELGAPFLYEVAVREPLRRRGLARALLDRSIRVLADRGEPQVAAWVTDGNAASEALLGASGFVAVTAAVEPAAALGYYRAAEALPLVASPRADAAVAATIDDGPALWVVDVAGPVESVRVRNTRVLVHRIDRDDPWIAEMASRAMPLQGAAWLLARRAEPR